MSGKGKNKAEAGAESSKASWSGSASGAGVPRHGTGRGSAAAPKSRPAEEGRARECAEPVSVGFVSLGCAKNLVDSQVMAGNLLKSGCRMAGRPEDADVVIVNTCAFIEDARKEARDAILDVCRLKRTGECRAILVAGCMPQRYGADLKSEFPDVDGFIGIDQLDKVGDLVKRLVGGQGGFLEITGEPNRLFDPDLPELRFTGKSFAYLKIAEGCNHHCAFCAIPGIRGRYRSRPTKSLLAEAEKLLTSGVKELNLVSQDTTWYGRDVSDTSSSFSNLIRVLGGLGSGFWIRLLYGYPSGITDELLAAIAETPQVCRYFDVPVQHSHPDVLTAMKRGGTARHVIEFPARVRAALPGVALRTTCLVGFPGESEVQFRHLLDYIVATEFDHVGVFVYSMEDGTPAANLGGCVPAKVAEQRREELLLVQRQIVEKKLSALVGQEDDVLIEGKAADGGFIGRSYRQAPDVDGCVHVSDSRLGGTPRPTGKNGSLGQVGRSLRLSRASAAEQRVQEPLIEDYSMIQIGDFARVRYTAHSDYDLEAKVVGQADRLQAVRLKDGIHRLI